MTTITRKTKETTVAVSLKLGGVGGTIETAYPFFNHMLGTLGRYAGVELSVKAEGDLKHHLYEDVALTLGRAFRVAAPAAAARYGERTIPMDDALVQVVVDLGGRPFFVGKLPSPLYTHVFRSFSTTAEANVHVRVLRGGDWHHVVEAGFKALGLSLRQALAAGGEGPFSTKGSVVWDEKP